MPKDLSLMQITVLVPTSKVHEAATWLEDLGATSMMVRAYRNGAAAEPSDGNDKRLSPTEQGSRQQAWIAKYVTRQMTTKEILPGWEAQNWPPRSLYAALYRAMDSKVLKKVRPGVYRPAKG